MSVLCIYLFIICVIKQTSGAADICPECQCTANGTVFGVGDRWDELGVCSLNICTGEDRWYKSFCPPVDRPFGWSLQPSTPCLPFPECCPRAVPPLALAPDILDQLGFAYFLGVNFGGRVRARQGLELNVSQVQNPPIVSYDYISDPKDWYVLVMLDADVPSRAEPAERSLLHWLVCNIPGRRVPLGETLAPYISPDPRPGTGLHRYFLLLFQQPCRLEFREEPLDTSDKNPRFRFSMRKFIDKYRLGDPLAINAFQAQYKADECGTCPRVPREGQCP